MNQCYVRASKATQSYKLPIILTSEIFRLDYKNITNVYAESYFVFIQAKKIKLCFYTSFVF